MLIPSVPPTDGSRVLAAAKTATRSAKSSGDLCIMVFSAVLIRGFTLYILMHILTQVMTTNAIIIIIITVTPGVSKMNGVAVNQQCPGKAC